MGQMTYLCFGSNQSGNFGTPQQTLATAIDILGKTCGIVTQSRSSFYLSEPIGPKWQCYFTNIVVAMQVSMPPAVLLRHLKQLEREAGRTTLGVTNGPRPLDIDILSHRSLTLNWRRTPKRQRGVLILPHPELHRRRFALMPLSEVAPHWQHPVLGIPIKTMLCKTATAGKVHRLNSPDQPS